MHVHALPRSRAERRPRRGPAEVVRRLRVCVRAADLDRQLAEGTQPWRSAELELRATQLTSAKTRTRFARELESIVARAECAVHDRSARIPLSRAAVLAAREDLLELAAALRSPASCRPHAAGVVSFLLHDGCSPLYDPAAGATPASLARVARAGFGQR
jgi:hypothetical protein